MKYMGSKARHAKHIIPFLMEHHTTDMWFIDCCVGGANLIDKVDHTLAPKRVGIDVHYYLIKMWQAVANGWLPPQDITEEKYKHIRQHQDAYPPELVGYVGFALSYGGKWWGGWSRDSSGKRNYVDEAYRNALKQFPKLLGVRFYHKSLFDLELKERCTLYIDPPYANTTKYKHSFDHEKFYDWCREKHHEGHTLYVSEYWMPEDFKCVWEKEVTNGLFKEKKAIEKLFKLAP